VEMFTIVSHPWGRHSATVLERDSVDAWVANLQRLSAINLPRTASGVESFSLHPGGKRFATAIYRAPYFWMLEGFDQPKSLLYRLLRR